MDTHYQRLTRNDQKKEKKSCNNTQEHLYTSLPFASSAGVTGVLEGVGVEAGGTGREVGGSAGAGDGEGDWEGLWSPSPVDSASSEGMEAAGTVSR